MGMLKDALLGDHPLEFRGSPEQQANIERVHHKIAPAILAFFALHGRGSTFRVDELRMFINAKFPSVAPDSAGRIMRDLRERGEIDYDVINRRQSLYRINK